MLMRTEPVRFLTQRERWCIPLVVGGFHLIKSLLQSFPQFVVRRALAATHPRMTAVATIDMLLQELVEEKLKQISHLNNTRVVALTTKGGTSDDRGNRFKGSTTVDRLTGTAST